MTSPHASPVLNRWADRAQAVLLSLGAVYLLAIAQLSPHPLPGLRWLAFAVLGAGLAAAFRSTPLRRVATGLCLLSVGLGCAAVGDIAIKSAGMSKPHERVVQAR